MQIWHLLVVLIIGVASGFINTLAGGGSLLTLPLLMFLGLPPSVANGTNRLAILVQNASASAGFLQKGVRETRFSAVMTLPALAGAWLGAKFAIDLDDALFKKILAGIMIVALVPIIFPPGKSHNKSAPLSGKRKAFSFVAFFFIGIYGGFIQAGVGFLFISVLVGLAKFDLIRANAIKVFIIFWYTIIAMLAFVMAGKIDWTFGAVLAIGSAIGAWIGSHWAVKKGNRWIMAVLVLMVAISAAKLVIS